MKRTYNSSSPLWAYIATSTGVVGYMATAASSLLSSSDVKLAAWIRDFGVTNSYWRPSMQNEFMTMLWKIFKMREK
jgi:hypothetical protein